MWFLLLVGLLWSNDTDVPSVLKERLNTTYEEQDRMRKDFIVALNDKKTFSQQETVEVIAINNFIVKKVEAVDVEISNCEATGEGFYCEEAERDLDATKARMKRLHELHKMIGKKDDV